MIIIPDIHGRSFWRAAVLKAGEGDEILFLGDYVDPYPDELITPGEALQEMKDVIALKKAHPDRVTLLLGNHDIKYEYPRMGGGRTDSKNFLAIRDLLMENRDIFDITAVREFDGKTVWLTHAGILKGWVRENYALFSSVTRDEIPDQINALFHGSGEDRSSLYYALSDVGLARWGTCIYGSPVWADAYGDHNIEEPEFEGIYQIFGHSQQESDPVVTDYWACLDCRRAFRLDEEGEVQEL